MWANGKWTKYATPGAMRIGIAMMATPTGRKEFNRIATSKTKIQMEINPYRVYSNNNKLKYGEMTSLSDRWVGGKQNLIEAKITIFLGSIESYVKNQLGITDSEKVEQVVNEEIGATGGHEANHTSDDNVQKNAENELFGDENDLEKEPTRVENQIKKEFKEDNWRACMMMFMLKSLIN